MSARLLPSHALFSVPPNFQLHPGFTSNSLSLPQASSCAQPAMSGATGPAGLRCTAHKAGPYSAPGSSTWSLEWCPGVVPAFIPSAELTSLILHSFPQVSTPSLSVRRLPGRTPVFPPYTQVSGASVCEQHNKNEHIFEPEFLH